MFNFRHVGQRIGIPLDNHTDWQMGQILRALAARRGIAPQHKLTDKTNPDPSVRAPHMIAHYPMEMFDAACDEIRDWWGFRSRQQDLFD